ncbi:hypothetical protein P7K49_029801 [Saguinus oedipus]|uniref:Uncharacterized protein n=1 Tax=Saguinus oedipus TaxID=9490 RepID=A0ABQ9U884_SAGOE|nr:hypothetical protein P7K49_029801 [Saguinus oedipus]
MAQSIIPGTPAWQQEQSFIVGMAPLMLARQCCHSHVPGAAGELKLVLRILRHWVLNDHNEEVKLCTLVRARTSLVRQAPPHPPPALHLLPAMASCLCQCPAAMPASPLATDTNCSLCQKLVDAFVDKGEEQPWEAVAGAGMGTLGCSGTGSLKRPILESEEAIPIRSPFPSPINSVVSLPNAEIRGFALTAN